MQVWQQIFRIIESKFILMTTICEFLNVIRFDSSAQTFVYIVYKDSDYTETFFSHPGESIIWLGTCVQICIISSKVIRSLGRSLRSVIHPDPSIN